MIDREMIYPLLSLSGQAAAKNYRSLCLPSMKIAALCLALFSGIAGSVREAMSDEPTDNCRRIEVDFSRVVGTIRPLHGVNSGPIAEHFTVDLSKYFRELQIPCVRLTLPNWPGVDCVHIKCVFPNMAADPDDPASYDFEKTDAYIAAVLAVGAKPVYTLLNDVGLMDVRGDKYDTIKRPPDDFKKWARICANIARHYNQGWANGFHHNIEYWEVWNEPDSPGFWTGSQEQYAQLYATVATALKEVDPKLKVGGPASYGNLTYVEQFLAICQQRKLPLDFCSWHCYSLKPTTILSSAKEVRRLLDKYGFTKTENHVNEWSPGPSDWNQMRADPLVARKFFDSNGSSKGGAFDVSVLCYLQDSPVDSAMFYSGDTLRWSFIDRNGAPKKSYFAFKAFRRILDTPRRVAAQGDDREKGLAVLAGLSADNSRAGILISNHEAPCQTYQILIRGLPWHGGTVCTRYDVDEKHDLDPVAEAKLPPSDTLLLVVPAASPSVSLLELGDVQRRVEGKQ